MRIASTLKGQTPALLALIGLGLVVPTLSMQMGCTAAKKDSGIPKPTITSFLASRSSTSASFDVNAPNVTITKGDSAWVKAFYAVSNGRGTLSFSTGTATMDLPNGIATEVKGLTASSTLTLTVQNELQDTVSKSLTVTVVNPPNTTITAPAGMVYAGRSGYTASVPAGPAGTTYKWTTSTGTITSGQASNVMTFSAGAIGNMTLTCEVTNPAMRKDTGTVTFQVFPNPPTAISYNNGNPVKLYQGVPMLVLAPAITGGDLSNTWTVNPALPDGVVLDAVTGVISGTPTAVTGVATYTVTGGNTGGTATFPLVLQVDPAPAVVFNTNKPTLGANHKAMLSWTIDASVTGVDIYENGGAAPIHSSATSGTFEVTVPATTTYKLVAHTGAGDYETSLTITVDTEAFSIATFETNFAQVNYGETANLSWTLNHFPDVLTLDGADVLDQSGWTVSPRRRQTFTLAGSNTAGSDSKTVSIVTRGLDYLLGDVSAGGFMDGTGPLAKFYFNTAIISGTTAGAMNLTMGGDGNIYVADALNHVVRMVEPSGKVTLLAGKPGVSFNYADATDVANATTGDMVGTAARFNRPAQVVYQDPSTLYVVDYGSHSVRKLSKQADGWHVTRQAGTPGTYGNASTATGLDNPLAGLYSPAAGATPAKLFIADGYTSSIRVCDLSVPISGTSTANLSTLAGGGTGQQYGLADGDKATARFRTLSGLTFDATGANIIVADRETHTIRQVALATGATTTVAGFYSAAAGGTPTATSGNLDGVGIYGATAAKFFRPVGITRVGNVYYVADNNNHEIRKIDGTTWQVTTVVGTGLPGCLEGIGTAAVLNGPEGLTSDAAGNLYVADAVNGYIRKIDAATFQTSAFAGARRTGLVNGQGTDALFAAPNGLAMDGTGTLWICDEGNKVIRKMDPTGNVTTVTGSYTTATATTANFTDPYTLTVDNAGNVYVIDRINATTLKVVKIAAGVATEVALTGATPALTNGSRGLAVSPDGTALYVANAASIQKFDLGTLAQTAAITTGLSSVNGMAVGPDGNLYWVEFGNHAVKKADANLGGITLIAGGNLSTNKGYVEGVGTSARFNAPVNLALAAEEGVVKKIYVVDQNNAAIRVIDLSTADNVVSTLVGLLDATVTNGGPGRIGAVAGTLSGTSGVYYPKGLAISPLTGDLFVATSDGIMQATKP